jgi:DNA-binding NarL/FixJ family response regulator
MISKNNNVKVFIVDDHPVVVEGLKALFHSMEVIDVIGSAGNAIDTMQFLKNNPVDIIMLDINLPDISGIDLCKKIKKEYPIIRMLGISNFSDRSYISRMIENGASGYLLKSASPEEIMDAIKTVLDGKLYLSLHMEHMLRPSTAISSTTLPPLTKREKEVLGLIAQGMTNNQIAEKLFISTLTVDSHRKNLLTKLKVNNTAALIHLAMEQNLF